MNYEQHETIITEYNGWTAHAMIEGNYINFYDGGDCFLSIPSLVVPPALPSQEVLNAILRAYRHGHDDGEKTGAWHARREIRVALGIESQDV